MGFLFLYKNYGCVAPQPGTTHLSFDQAVAWRVVLYEVYLADLELDSTARCFVLDAIDEDRLRFAKALGGETVAVDAIVDEELLNRSGTTLGQVEVVDVRTIGVGVALDQ